ncbi:pyridoxal-phosphate dependent enzyme [Streptomyces tailanensis]|uniref:pyridoxal-phosphate dependent enzyme n=1 Tax=Streptomyces tailanensis TaxID=2569858 RepID=UPI00122DF951|nr:pyridoxal-phosphate dependent enzyme [Streptomyces tailanensis]
MIGATSCRTVPHPLAGTRPEIPAGARLYRTGDLARHTADGTVEWRGRLDSQVKVRGFRVELGEITVALQAHPQIAEAVVVLHDGRLAAYYVPAAGPGLTITELRTFLRRTLPEPMVPHSFTTLSALPLSANGKTDTSALPEPDGTRPALGSVYQAPASALFGHPPGPRHIPGLGTSRRPEILRPGLVDEVVLVPEPEAVAMCRLLATTRGIAVGGSTGSVLAAVVRLRPSMPADATAVAIGPDTGERYLDTVYDDDWVRDRFGPALPSETHSSPLAV